MVMLHTYLPGRPGATQAHEALRCLGRYYSVTLTSRGPRVDRLPTPNTEAAIAAERLDLVVHVDTGAVLEIEGTDVRYKVVPGTPDELGKPGKPPTLTPIGVGSDSSASLSDSERSFRDAVNSSGHGLQKDVGDPEQDSQR